MWIQKPEPPWTPPPRVPGQPRPRRPPPHDPERVDWLTALNDADLAAPELAGLTDLEAVRTDSLEIVALLQGIAASRRLDAVEPLFAMAFELDGVFRDECGRQIRSMESYAIPALVRLAHQKNLPGQSRAKQRRYASYQLDRMDRARPSKAVSTASDDRVRAEILHAYGETQALEAVETVLNQVDSASHRVRREARWAWLRYVAGKAPPPAPKRKRKLPGGKEEQDEKPDYLTYREIALLALQKQLETITHAPVDPQASAKQLTDELFAYYDRLHAAEWDEQLRTARDKQQRGDVKGAAGEFGWILAHDPNHPRRAEMAPAFAAYAEQLRAAGERSRALGYYRLALDLDPQAADARRLAAAIAYLDGLDALERGSADAAPFRRALALNPRLSEARAALSRAESRRGRHLWAATARAVSLGLALVLLVWLLWRWAGANRTASAEPAHDG
jgi:hypothetical protein